MRRVVINGAFRGQVITGQQRFASELSAEMLKRSEVREASMPEWVSRRTLLAWAWVQILPLIVKRDEVLVSLTSRAPAFARRHAVVVHDLFVITHPEWYSFRYFVTHAPLLQLQIRTARQVFAVSEPVAKELNARFKRIASVEVIPNAPAGIFKEMKQQNSPVLSQHGLVPRGYLLSVATRDPRKNLALLAEAYGTLPTSERELCPLILVGGDNSRVFRSPSGGSVGVLGIGRVADHELAELYGHARAVIFPSLDEGFGLPAVEAMASGAALVVSDVPVLRWVCGPFAQFVSPSSVNDWAAALLSVIHQPPVPPRGASAWVRERFDWGRSADKLLLGVLSEERP